jgi:hypothetical protein
MVVLILFEEGFGLPFPACTMHADSLQDFQIGRIFP